MGDDILKGLREFNQVLRELERAQRGIGNLAPGHGGQYYGGQPPRYTGHPPRYNGQQPRYNGPNQRELDTLACFRDPSCVTSDEARAMRQSDKGVDLNEFWTLISSYNVQGKAFTSLDSLTKMATSCHYSGHIGSGEKLVPNTPEVQSEACFLVNEQLNRRGGRW